MTYPKTIYSKQFLKGLSYDVIVSDRTENVSAGFGLKAGMIYFSADSFSISLRRCMDKTEFYRRVQLFIRRCEENEEQDERAHEVSNSGYCAPKLSERS